MIRTDNGLRLQVWTETQCEKVFQAVQTVLENTGCLVKSEAARELLGGAGCPVEGNLVKIPGSVLKEAVASAPSSFTLYNRDGEPAMSMDTEHSYFGPPISTVFIKDVYTGEKRRGERKDAYHAGLICEALENVDWSSAMSGITDGVSSLSDVYEVYEQLHATTKPIMYWAGSMKNLKTEMKMFETVAGSPENLSAKPGAICLICPMDPLVHNEDSMEQIIYLARRRMPVVYISGVSLGCTGPITIAGSVVVGLADTLAGLVVSQLACPGAPFVVSRFSDTMDMRSMTVQRSHPEMVLSHMCCNDVMRYLNLPFAVNLGDTDSGVFDQTAAFDQTVSLYSGALGFSTMNMSMGGFESANLTDYAGTVFGDEVVSYLKVLMNGAEVSDDTLALEDIDEVGPGENFLLVEDTIELFREMWTPKMILPRSLEAYRKGAPDLRTLYEERIREIIEAGPKKPLPEEIRQKLAEILEEAEKA